MRPGPRKVFLGGIFLGNFSQNCGYLGYCYLDILFWGGWCLWNNATRDLGGWRFWRCRLFWKNGLITCQQRQRTASWFENIPPYVKSTRQHLTCERFKAWTCYMLQDCQNHHPKRSLYFSFVKYAKTIIQIGYVTVIVLFLEIKPFCFRDSPHFKKLNMYRLWHLMTILGISAGVRQRNPKVTLLET